MCKIMSRKGNGQDNAVGHKVSFIALKTELIHQQVYQAREQAKQAVFEEFEMFYNRERFHSVNGYLSPTYYELRSCYLTMFIK